MADTQYRPEQDQQPKADKRGEVEDTPAEAGTEAKPDAAKKSRNIAITVGVLVILAVAGVFWYLHSQTYEDTDDAQIDGHIAPISARIAGTVTAVYVQDNDRVQVGRPLVDLDTRTQMANLEQSRAQLSQATAQLAAQQPNVPITRNNSKADVSSDDAQLAIAEATVSAAQSDRDQSAAKLADAQAQAARDQLQLQRYKSLYEKREASREDYEKYVATAASSDANVAASHAALLSAAKVVEQRKAQLAAQRTKRDQDIENAPQQLAIRQADIKTQRANADSAKAALDKAQLDLSFTRIVAPVSGIVTQRVAEIGTHVAEGAQMLMIVQSDDIWVTANFKETQLRKMRVNQSVRIHVDALDRDFDGYIESMPAITGSRSSVLPPENATGNYVKVVQRLPLRIRFKPGQDGLDWLRLGMSTEPRVFVR